MKTICAFIPVDMAVDLVQLRLQVIADGLRACSEAAEAPDSAEIEDAYKELINLAEMLKEVEKKKEEHT